MNQKINVPNKPGIGVVRRGDESIDSLLSRFKKEIIKSDILNEYKERESFVKPSVKNRLKKSQRLNRARKTNLE
jgi:small subunit ribosomal protein S21